MRAALAVGESDRYQGACERDGSWESSQPEKELLLALTSAIFYLYFCLENKRVSQTPVEESSMEKGNGVIFKPQLNLWRWKSKQRQKPFPVPRLLN